MSPKKSFKFSFLCFTFELYKIPVIAQFESVLSIIHVCCSRRIKLSANEVAYDLKFSPSLFLAAEKMRLLSLCET